MQEGPTRRRHDPLEGVTPAGMIRTGADRSRIPDAYGDVLVAAVAAVAQGAPGVSVYLYGSVATGTAVVPDSDVDLFTIGLPAERAARIGRDLSNRFADVSRAIQVGAAHPDDYEGDGWAAYGNRVFLRHYCVHLAGPDPRAGLPDHPADAAAARGFNGDIGIHAERWRSELARPVDATSLARRIGRKCLFAVAGLVSVHDDTWTTDRGLAAERWSAIEPGMAGGLSVLLSWSEGEERPSRPDIGVALEGVVARTVGSFEQMIGLW